MSRGGRHGAGADAPAELLRALGVLAEPPGPEHERLADLIGLEAPPDPAGFTEVLVLQLPPYASIHLGSEGMLGGVARARIAGFWTALGHAPPPEPDHLAALLGLQAALVEAERSAEGAERALLANGRVALLHEHLASWVFGWLDRVAELDVGPYRAWAELLARTLSAEVRRAGSDTLPLHLREAPALPDPRLESGSSFVTGVLSPVRSGMILTRAGLARMARGLGLGVRLGERRYVLEHLLGLEPGGVLSALAGEARRQAGEHRSRRDLLGRTARFWEARANAAATLLDELAAEGDPAPAASEVRSA